MLELKNLLDQKFIPKRVIFFCIFIVMLPYIFRIMNLDYKIISFYQNKIQSSFQVKTKISQENQYILGYVEFYPYTYTDKNKNNPSGIFIDIARNVFEYYQKNINSNVDFIYQSLPASRLFEGLKNGNVHIFIGIKNIPSIQSYTIASKEKIGTIEMRLYFTNQYPPKIQIREAKDLMGESVILIKGYAYSGWADLIKNNNKINYIEALDHQIAFEMLLRKRANFLLEYKEPAEEILQRIKNNELSYQVISKLDCYFVVSKKLNNAEKFVAQLDEIYQKLYKKKD